MQTKLTKAKAVAAAVGGFCTVTVSVLADDVLSVDEGGTLIAGLIALAATVWAVWRVPNKPVQ